MSTLSKIFNFRADAEAWVGTTTEPTVVAAWFPPATGGKARAVLQFLAKRNDPLKPLYALGGCLRMTARQDTPSSANYWEWTGTWEDLGVPAGATITAVAANYQYRVDQAARRLNFSQAEWANGDFQSGPFELRDSGGTLIDTFSVADVIPERTSADFWNNYPAGNVSDPITENPNSWRQIVGSTLPISHPSSTTIKLRLNCITPPTAPYSIGRNAMFARLKQDRVELTITYTPAGTTYVNINSVIFGID